MEHSKTVLLSARNFFLGTLLSRFGGMLRDMATAACIGSGQEVSCFFVAFRIAHLFRRWIGEGSFQVGFTPRFEQLRMEGRSMPFFADAFWSLLALTGVLVLVGEGILWGVGYLGGRASEVAYLAMLMLPGLIPIAMYSIGSALLQCERRFFLPAAAPALFNAIWVVAALALAPFALELRVQGLAVAVVVALCAQGLLPMAPAVRLAGRTFWRGRLFSEEARKMFAPLSLGAVGVGAMQLNGLLDSVFALYAEGAGPAHLWYAIRIQQLPVGLVGVAMASSLLPPLSRAVAAGDEEGFVELMRGTLRRGVFLMVPCVVGFFLLGGVGVNLLYGRGAFTEADVLGTMHCLWGYGVGLLPSFLVLLGAQGFYARGNYVRPMWGAVLSVGVNAVLNGVCVLGLGFGAASVAFATSLGSVVNAAVLFADCRRWVPWTGIARAMAVSGLAAVTALGCSYLLHIPINGLWPRNVAAQVAHFSVLAGAYGGTVLLFLWKEVREWL